MLSTIASLGHEVIVVIWWPLFIASRTSSGVGQSVMHLLYVCLSVVCFYARQLYRQLLLRARTSYTGILYVRLSVCPGVTTRYRTTPRWDRDSGFSPYGRL